ncbi:MAG: hypothetical protein Q8P41_15345 [Pseudomonadota bacterium]|nr:hypothetical protein [Pseudomonadota bacterium]
MPGQPGGRIHQRTVPALFPEEGPVCVVLYGEAPGPLGADRSGLPFWGDRSGRLVYRALVAAGMAEVPERAWAHWEGGELARQHLRPTLHGVALSNAFASCPTKDGERFCAPSNAELRQPENLARIRAELDLAARRCPGTLSVIALGRRADWALAEVARSPEAPPFTRYALPHPSAQALLATAPDNGRGARLVDLQREWEAALAARLAAVRAG